MNIPSIESLYATIEQQQRVIKQAHEDIAKLNSSLDNAGMIIERLTNERDSLLDAQAKSLQTIVKLTAERDAALVDLETERLRLAACGVAALGYFDGCKDEYYSASLTDTIILYEQNQQLKSALREAKEAFEAIKPHVQCDPYARLIRAIATINKVLGEE